MQHETTIKDTAAPSLRYYLWEAPLRVFHWLLVLSIVGMFITINIDQTEWHGRLGILVLGLLMYRLTLGFLGGEMVRFSRFLGTPSSIRDYLKGVWRGFGHNPLGAWSALGLIALCLAQALSGLMSNDDIAFDGPWVAAISKDMSDQFTKFHHLMSNFLMVLIGLHIAAILFYTLVKKDRLVPPMITGWKAPHADQPAPDKPLRHSHPAAVVTAVAVGIISMVLAAKGGARGGLDINEVTSRVG